MQMIRELSRLTGVSVRALQYYDKIGLLPPTAYTASGYRLYDEAALERLQQILLFRELQFPLQEIKRILDSPDFDRDKAVEQQITLLTLQKERLEGLISFAREILKKGECAMDFSAFSTEKQNAYAAQAKAQWGHTDAFQEFEAKTKNHTQEQTRELSRSFMALFGELGAMKELPPDAQEVQRQVKRLQSFITQHFYTCTDQIFRQLGQAYAAGGEMTENIDHMGGPGTAAFAAQAIAIFLEEPSRHS